MARALSLVTQVFVLGLAAYAGGSIQRMGAVQPAGTQDREVVRGEIRVRRIVLVDEKERPRIVLEVEASSDGSRLYMQNSDGEIVAQLQGDNAQATKQGRLALGVARDTGDSTEAGPIRVEPAVLSGGWPAVLELCGPEGAGLRHAVVDLGGLHLGGSGAVK